MGGIKEIKKVLVANRGEIALRVIQTCRGMGIETVTMFTESERDLPHAMAGNQAIALGEGKLSETYLNQDLIVSEALKYGVDAIHPGYGFLSENAEFCKKVEGAGILFIGPTPHNIELMGDKRASKEKIVSLNVPAVPGYHGANQDPILLEKEAAKIGYPVLIKASAGGGGKGMRIVFQAEEFAESLEAAKREALNAFGDDIVLIEKFIENPRHIEVQVLSDLHGNHLHVFERECSIQRRHQKIIEESPSPVVSKDDNLKKRMLEAAVDICRGIDYRGVGTIEYILDDNGEFYFLEMNTRLQVEHPVTEMVTGIDLVKQQIQVAAGGEVKLSQKDIVQKGHAIEARIYAEDPDNDFMPAIGKILHMGQSTLRNVRFDSGYRQGNTVGINFDPMLAKLIVWGETREEAIRLLSQSLDDFPFLGLTTNNEYLNRILNHEKFISGDTYTHFVKTHEKELKAAALSEEEMALAIVAHHKAKTYLKQDGGDEKRKAGAWDSLMGKELS